MFLMIMLFLVLFVLIAIFLGVRNKDHLKEGGEDVIKSVYVYLVLFATLMMTIGGTVASFMAIADMVAPTPYYQTFEEFKANDGFNRKVDIDTKPKMLLSFRKPSKSEIRGYGSWRKKSTD